MIELSETQKAMQAMYDRLRGQGKSHIEAMGALRREGEIAAQRAAEDLLGRKRTRNPIEFDLAIEDFRRKAEAAPHAGVIMALADFPNDFAQQDLDSVSLDVHAIHFVALADLLLGEALKRWPKGAGGGAHDRRRDVEAARRALGFDVSLEN